MTDKKIVYPITLDVSFYLINQDGDVAKISIGFISGMLPTHQQIVDKLNEQVATMQGDGEGLKGAFRICDYDEYCNAKLEQVNPIAASAGPFAWTMEKDRVWFAAVEGCGCAECDFSDPISKEHEALKLAVALLSKNEPGDSRAVSDVFVALAGVATGDTSDNNMNIIRAVSKGFTEPKPPVDDPVEAPRPRDPDSGLQYPSARGQQPADYHNSYSGLDADGRAED